MREISSEIIADELIEKEIADARLDPDSAEARDFRMRARVFGINGVQPIEVHRKSDRQDAHIPLGGKSC